MRVVRRLLVWIGKIGLLTAVGVPVYLYVRHSPCCTVDGFVELQALSSDGRTLLVSDFSARWHKEAAGKDEAARKEPEQFKLVDTRSGRVVQSFDQVTGSSQSPNGQQFALQIGQDIVVVDLLARTHWTLPNCDDLLFTPSGKWLRVRQDKTPVLVGADSGRIAWRLAKDWPDIRFYCDDRFVQVPRADGDFELIEVATRQQKRLPVSKLDFPKHGAMIASGDGRWLVFGEAYHIGGRSGAGPLWEPSCHGFWKCEIWDWQKRKHVVSLPRRREPWTVTFHDNQRVAVWHGYKELRDFKFIDLETRSETRIVFPAGLFALKTLDETQQSFSCSGQFSLDGAHFLVSHSFNDGQRLAMIETGTGRVLWWKANWDIVCFGPNGTCLLDERDAQHRRNLRIVETTSGKVLGRIDSNLQVDYDRMPFYSPFDDKGCSMVLSSLGEQWQDPTPWQEWFRKHMPWFRLAESPGLAVVDLTTGRQRFAVQQYAPHFFLSGDGNTLATRRSHTGAGGDLASWRVEVWDLQPHRALFWSVTISISVGLIGWLVGRKPWQRRAVAGGST